MRYVVAMHVSSTSTAITQHIDSLKAISTIDSYLEIVEVVLLHVGWRII